MAFSEWLDDPRTAIARRDLRSLSREKTIVLALLIQLFVAAFSSFLVVGLTSLYDPGAVGGGELAVGVTGEHSDELEAAAAGIDGIEVAAYPDNATAFQVFQQGGVDAVLHADRGTDKRIQVTATAPDGSLKTTLVVVQLRSILEKYERSEREQRAAHVDSRLAPLPDEVDASPYFGFTYTILIPLLLFLPPFISGSIAVDAITEEIERGTLELLRVSPVTIVDIVDGKAAAMAVLAPVQALLWIALLAANGITVANVALLILTVAAMATIVVVLGIALGLTFGERRNAQLVYSVGVLALFGSAIVLPEHPSTTIAKLAVDSPTATTYGLVGLYAAIAVGLFVVIRRYVAGVDVESL